ncbi:MAG: DUF2723 domain-containing protein [Gemmatimonadetes bacterium]|nr:MAG: DUF2723 domain-containing protein [Gemmatimonadota bacterium]
MHDYRPPYREAALATLAVLALYVATLAPTTTWWDTSEYIATAHILGIPHPPGNPLFVVLGKVWSLLLAPLGLPVAVRINLLAATTSALATGFLFLISHRVLSAVMEKRWMATVGAAAGALIGATAYTVWNQSNVNEKVYTVSVMTMAAACWLAVRWFDRRDRPEAVRYLVGAIYLGILGSTNHLMSLLMAPAVGVLVLLARPGVLFSTRFLARAVPAVLIGLSFNFFLPIRAAEDPVINEGDPTCESAASAVVAVYTLGKAGCPALADNLTRKQYLKPPVTQRQAPFSDQLENYYQYFEWQWARSVDPSPVPWGARLPFAMIFLGLGVMGLVVAWQADRRLFGFLAALVGTLTLGLVFYLNFKYGFSLAPHITDLRAHEVRERDYFFVASFIVWGNLAGVGLAGLWKAVGDYIGGARGLRLAAPMFLVAFVPLALNAGWADRRGDYAARDWAYDLLMSVEPYGILFTNGDNDTFPLWYLQEVEGIRQDVTVIVVQYLYTSWYPKQLRDLTDPARQRLFDGNQSGGVYSGAVARPSRAITVATDEQLDQVGSGTLPRDFTVPLGPVGVTYPAGTYLDRGQRIALNIIHDALPERPIFFATTGGLIADLGLRDWGVRYGLATKLVMRDLNRDAPEGWVKGTDAMGGEWFDLERNLKLVNEVYSYRGLRDRELWPDLSTVNIPMHYQFLFAQLADAAQVAGMGSEVIEPLIEGARAFRLVAGGGTKVAARLGGG